MYRTYPESHQDDNVVAYGMKEDTLPGDWWQYADEPDWIITQEPDYDPLEPDGDYFPYTIIFNGTPGWNDWGRDSSVLDTVNHQWAPWVSPVEEVSTALRAFDNAGLGDPWEVAARYFRIFHGVETRVFDGPGDIRYFGMASQKWIDAVGFTGELDDCYVAWREYHDGEAYYLAHHEWDSDLGAYQEVDRLYGTWGYTGALDMAGAFGLKPIIEPGVTA